MKRLLIFITTLLLTASAANAQNPTRLSLEVQYNSSRPKTPINFRAWLEANRNDYRDWLSRLQ